MKTILIIGGILLLVRLMGGKNHQRRDYKTTPITHEEKDALGLGLFIVIGATIFIWMMSSEAFSVEIGYEYTASEDSGVIIFDISDYNWGSEYNSIDEFKAFTRKAQRNINFGGYYVQVIRSKHENNHWKEIVKALDEMGVPYGLYIYTPAKTQAEAQKQYNEFLKIIDGVSMKYNLFPLMIDLEARGDQSEVIPFYNSVLEDEYILYACANDIYNYKYYDLAPQLWVAHWGLQGRELPSKGYDDYMGDNNRYKFLGEMAAIWQFTSKGDKTLLGTTHLDMSQVSDWWYNKYVK